MSGSWLPWRRNKTKGLLGIEMTPDGLALAQVSTDRRGARSLTHCAFLNVAATDDIEAALQEKVDALNLAKMPCNWVLPPSNYSLLLLEAPNVAPEEMREAMRWKIKELIPFSVESSTIDIFPLPDDGVRTGKKMVYVVATQQKKVHELIGITKSAKIILQSIDISEMAIRNIVETLAEDERGIAVVRLRQGGGSLSLIRKDRLYLSRQFEVAYNGGLFDDLPEEALILELQRSLDYYDRQMGQASPSKIYFCGENISPEKITPTMKNSLPGTVEFLDLANAIGGVDQHDPHLVQLCLGAIGGAMRMKVAA